MNRSITVSGQRIPIENHCCGDPAKPVHGTTDAEPENWFTRVSSHRTYRFAYIDLLCQTKTVGRSTGKLMFLFL